MNAVKDVVKELKEGEEVESVVFGAWGWQGYGEPKPPPVPVEKQGVILPWSEAKLLMEGWSFNGGFGAPQCYAVNIWTNWRVLYVVQYDGATGLESVPRNPVEGSPSMPGG